MRILVVYATKYGCTAECAEMLAERLRDRGAEAVVAEAPARGADPTSFDAILVGGSVYMGRMRPAATRWLKRHQRALLARPLGLFACCYTPDGTERFLESLFPAYLLSHARAAACVGGRLDYERMSPAYRKLFMSLKRIPDFDEKFTEPEIDEAAITHLADAMCRERERVGVKAGHGPVGAST